MDSPGAEEKLRDMMGMGGTGENQDVIQINKNGSASRQDVVEDGLENNWALGETKWHDEVFIVAAAVFHTVFYSSPSLIHPQKQQRNNIW